MVGNIDLSLPLDTLIHHLTLVCESLLDIYAPVKTRTVLLRKPQIWFNQDIAHLKRLSRKYKKIWKQSPTDRNWDRYRFVHQSYQYAIHHEKCKNLSQKVLALKDNPKALYDLIDNLIGTVKDNPLPECASDQQLADRFSKFFFDKIAAIRDNLDSFATFTPPSEKCETKLSAFKEVTMEQVC